MGKKGLVKILSDLIGILRAFNKNFKEVFKHFNGNLNNLNSLVEKSVVPLF